MTVVWDYMELVLGKEAGARNTVILALRFSIPEASLSRTA